MVEAKLLATLGTATPETPGPSYYTSAMVEAKLLTTLGTATPDTPGPSYYTSAMVETSCSPHWAELHLTPPDLAPHQALRSG